MRHFCTFGRNCQQGIKETTPCLPRAFAETGPRLMPFSTKLRAGAQSAPAATQHPYRRTPTRADPETALRGTSSNARVGATEADGHGDVSRLEGDRPGGKGSPRRRPAWGLTWVVRLRPDPERVRAREPLTHPPAITDGIALDRNGGDIARLLQSQQMAEGLINCGRDASGQPLVATFVLVAMCDGSQRDRCSAVVWCLPGCDFPEGPRGSSGFSFSRATSLEW